MPLDLFDWADSDIHLDAQVAAKTTAQLPASTKQLRSARNHRAGHAAEDAVQRDYERAGFELAARRWRGKSGEIDLIFRDGARIICVEVKAARTHDAALARILPRQIARIFKAAEEFVAGEPLGQRTDLRFDAGLVDAQGRVAIQKNALSLY